MKNKTKNYIELSLRAYHSGSISFDEAVNGLLSMFSNSRKFNYPNFSLGFYLGIAVGLFLLKFVVPLMK